MLIRGGGGVTQGKLTERAFPWVGILTFTRCPSYPRRGKLTFSRCLGVGNLTLASMKMSNSPGSATPPPPPASPWGLTLISALTDLDSNSLDFHNAFTTQVLPSIPRFWRQLRSFFVPLGPRAILCKSSRKNYLKLRSFFAD